MNQQLKDACAYRALGLIQAVFDCHTHGVEFKHDEMLTSIANILDDYDIACSDDEDEPEDDSDSDDWYADQQVKEMVERGEL